MKVYVDDLRKLPDDSWTLARTNTEAIRLLATGHVEEISIDHDICVPGDVNISASVRRRLCIGQETFQPIFYYITLMPEAIRPKKITIHTANPAEAVRMHGLLKDHGIESEMKEGHYNIDLNEDEY